MVKKLKAKGKVLRKGEPRKLKSRTFRRIFTKTPGGRTVLHFKKKKPGKAKCAMCGSVLAGVARERDAKMKKLGKTKKRPSRAYGGYYCGKCIRKVIKERER